jgi:hypothetical protein
MLRPHVSCPEPDFSKVKAGNQFKANIVEKTAE